MTFWCTSVQLINAISNENPLDNQKKNEEKSESFCKNIKGSLKLSFCFSHLINLICKSRDELLNYFFMLLDAFLENA